MVFGIDYGMCEERTLGNRYEHGHPDSHCQTKDSQAADQNLAAPIVVTQPPLFIFLPFLGHDFESLVGMRFDGNQWNAEKHPPTVLEPALELRTTCLAVHCINIMSLRAALRTGLRAYLTVIYLR